MVQYLYQWTHSGLRSHEGQRLLSPSCTADAQPALITFTCGLALSLRWATALSHDDSSCSVISRRRQNKCDCKRCGRLNRLYLWEHMGVCVHVVQVALRVKVEVLGHGHPHCAGAMAGHKVLLHAGCNGAALANASSIAQEEACPHARRCVHRKMTYRSVEQCRSRLCDTGSNHALCCLKEVANILAHKALQHDSLYLQTHQARRRCGMQVAVTPGEVCQALLFIYPTDGHNRMSSRSLT